MRSQEDSILGMIGLATKAGKTITGAEGCEKAIKSAKAQMVLLAGDASEKTKEPVIRMCEYNNAPYRIFASKEALGRYTGKPNRAVVVITDNGFAKRILEKIDQDKQQEPQ